MATQHKDEIGLVGGERNPSIMSSLNDLLYKLKSEKQEEYLKKREKNNLQRQQQQQPQEPNQSFLGDIMTAQTSMFVQKRDLNVADASQSQEIR